MISSGFATSNKQQPSILKVRNSISEGVPFLSNYCNAITSKKIIKSKLTNCDQSHRLLPKYTKITRGQKLAHSIYTVAKKLRFSCKRKIKPTEQAVKQLL